MGTRRRRLDAARVMTTTLGFGAVGACGRVPRFRDPRPRARRMQRSRVVDLPPATTLRSATTAIRASLEYNPGRGRGLPRPRCAFRLDLTRW